MELAGKPTRCSSAAAGTLLLTLAVVASSGAWTASSAQSASGVTATYIVYNAPSVHWELGAVGASCAAWDEDKSPEWRSRYWWTAFCDGDGALRGDAVCGLCLLVTNAATGAQATVRIVDDCGRGHGGVALGLDEAVFVQINTDGSGLASGQLKVHYEFVDCHDG